jgi:hypothetical protein
MLVDGGSSFDEWARFKQVTWEKLNNDIQYKCATPMQPDSSTSARPIKTLPVNYSCLLQAPGWKKASYKLLFYNCEI